MSTNKSRFFKKDSPLQTEQSTLIQCAPLNVITFIVINRLLKLFLQIYQNTVWNYSQPTIRIFGSCFHSFLVIRLSLVQCDHINRRL